MPDQPFKSLLDREKAQAEVQEHFQPQLDVLADMVNYGTNLIPRLYRSSEKQTIDVVVCGVLLKQVVSMLDATESQARVGIVHASFLSARAALEASLFIDWILFSDSKRKADCYVVACLRHERMWALRSVKGTPESTAFESVTGELGIDMHTIHPTLEADARKHLEEVERNIARSGLVAIDREFDRLKKRDYDPPWYLPAGAKTIRQIAKQVGRLPQYEFCYSKGSHVTHSSLYKDHVEFRKGEVRLQPVRGMRDIDQLLTNYMPVAFATYFNLLKYYRPGEVKAFAKRYAEEWREPFRSIKKIKTVG